MSSAPSRARTFERDGGRRAGADAPRRSRSRRARGCGSARGARARARRWRCAAGSTCRRCFGSRATSLVSRMGPFGGRALRAGDVLPIGRRRRSSTRRASPAATAAGAARRRRAAARDARAARSDVHAGGVSRRCSASRFIDHAAVESHGLPPRGPALEHAARRRHPVGRDAARLAPGAGVGPADPVDGRSSDDRRLSEDRDRDHAPICRSRGSSRRVTGSSSRRARATRRVDALERAAARCSGAPR